MMSKVAFLAGFVATFVIMDGYFLDGVTTRLAWHEIGYAAHEAQTKITHWARPIGRR